MQGGLTPKNEDSILKQTSIHEKEFPRRSSTYPVTRCDGESSECASLSRPHLFSGWRRAHTFIHLSILTSSGNAPMKKGMAFVAETWGTQPRCQHRSHQNLSGQRQSPGSELELNSMHRAETISIP
jgi:hypothetical protein